MSGHLDELYNLWWLPHNRVAVATNGPVIRILQLPGLSCTVNLDDGHTDTVLCLDVSADGKWLLSAGKDRTVRLWDTQRNRYVCGVVRLIVRDIVRLS